MKKTGRYDVSSSIEAQFEPGSRGRVLRNLLGITRVREMNRVEAVALQSAMDRNHRPMAAIFADLIERSLGAS